MLSFWELIKNIDVDYSDNKNISNDEKQVLFELNSENKYKNFEKIIEFRELILELNSELGLY
jgi:hypothetical protein